MHASVEFLGKTMVAVWLPYETTGGKSGIIGEEMSSSDKEKLENINEALKNCRRH